MTINAAIAIPNVTDVDKLWCVFEHHLPDPTGVRPPEIIYVNACKLFDVFKLRDGRENSDWCNIYENGGPVIVNILHIVDNHNDARRLAIERAGMFTPRPRCNVHGWNLRSASRPIMCSNGKTYNTQGEAATDLGVAQSNISRCLRGTQASAGGHRFAYAPLPKG